MPCRIVTNSAIMLFCLGTFAFAFVYGPAKRKFVVPDKKATVQSARELGLLWNSTGVHGRIAVIFTRHLDHRFSGDSFPETDYLDTAMRQGIVRRAYYIVPDRDWSEVVSRNILARASMVPAKPTDTGFMILHEGGRIHVMPLSKYIPEQEHEKALIVIDPDAWSQQEQLRINSYFKSGQLTADLVAIISNAGPSR